MAGKATKARQIARNQSMRNLNADVMQLAKRNSAAAAKYAAIIKANGKLPLTLEELKEKHDDYVELITRTSEATEVYRYTVDPPKSIEAFMKDIENLSDSLRIIDAYIETGNNIEEGVLRDLKAHTRRLAKSKYRAARRNVVVPFRSAFARDSFAGIVLRGSVNKLKGGTAATRGLRSLFGLDPRKMMAQATAKAAAQAERDSKVDYSDLDDDADMDTSLNGRENPAKTPRSKRKSSGGRISKRKASTNKSEAEKIEEKRIDKEERKKSAEFAEGLFDRLDKLIKGLGIGGSGALGAAAANGGGSGSGWGLAGAAAVGAGLWGGAKKFGGKVLKFAKAGGILAAGGLAYDMIAGKSSRGSQGESFWGGPDGNSTMDSRGAGYGAAALGGATIGAFAGPLGAAIGGVLGAAVYGVKDFWSDIADSSSAGATGLLGIAAQVAKQTEQNQESNAWIMDSVRKVVLNLDARFSDSPWKQTWSQVVLSAQSAASTMHNPANPMSAGGTYTGNPADTVNQSGVVRGKLLSDMPNGRINNPAGSSADLSVQHEGFSNMDSRLLNIITNSEGTSDAKAIKAGYTDGAGGSAAYNVTLGYGKYIGGEKPDLTNMTINEVIELQGRMLQHPENNFEGVGSSAAGKYQIVRKTLRGLVKAMGLTGNEKFDAKMQDAMALHLAKGRGWERYKKGEISFETLMNNMNQEWASLPNAAGNTPKGRASYTPGEIFEQVENAKLQDDLGIDNRPKSGVVQQGSGGLVGMPSYSNPTPSIPSNDNINSDGKYAPVVTGSSLAVPEDLSPPDSAMAPYQNTNNPMVVPSGMPKPGFKKSVVPATNNKPSGMIPSIDSMPVLENHNLWLVSAGRIKG